MAISWPRHLQAFVESPCFIAVAIGPVQVGDRLGIHAREAAGVARDDLAGYRYRLVGRVVEQLNLEAIARVFELADRIDQPVDDKLLVEDGQLHRDEGQLALGIASARLIPLRCVLLVAKVEPH